MKSQNITRDAAIKGGLWSAVDRFGRQGVQFVVQLILARLLLPEDFGLIAMVTVVVQIASVFVRAGFGAGIIQKETLDQTDASTAFWLNMGLALVVYGILFSGAPWIAFFYNEPELSLLTRVLALNLITGGINNIQISLLQRNLEFKKIFLSTLPGTILSGILGVSAALAGWGAWALVVQMVSGTFFSILLLWKISGWYPSFQFSGQVAKRLLRFGSNVVGVQFIEQFFRQLYTLVIGAVYSPALLGYYSRSQAIQQMPTMTVTSVVNQVALPSLSRSQNDRERMVRGLRESIQLLSLVVGPGMVALALLAEPLVRVVLTEKWLPMVPYLQLFCIIGFLEPRYRLITQALLACGRSEDALRLSIYRRLVDLVVLAFTFDKGLIWIVGGQVASFGVGRFVDEVIMRRSLVYRIRDQWVDSVPVIVTSLFMFSFIESVGHLVENRALGYLCISMVPVGFSFAIGFFLFKRDMMTKTIKRLLSQPVSAAK
jgi:O-antigen/teichoic acid export membrane protein